MVSPAETAAATGHCPTGSLRRLHQPGKASTPRGTHKSLGAKFGEDSSQRIAEMANLGPKRVVSSPGFVMGGPMAVTGGPMTGHTGDITPRLTN